MFPIFSCSSSLSFFFFPFLPPVSLVFKTKLEKWAEEIESVEWIGRRRIDCVRTSFKRIFQDSTKWAEKKLPKTKERIERKKKSKKIKKKKKRKRKRRRRKEIPTEIKRPTEYEKSYTWQLFLLTIPFTFSIRNFR